MANSASARKSARQAATRRLLNASLRSAYRTAVKSVRKAVSIGDAIAANAAFKSASSAIDRIADKNIVHKNKAARHKSRLNAAVKAIAVQK
jgi:small subunit ribosomal protein S20